MQVLEDHHDRLGLALTKEQPLHAVENLLASLRRIEVFPLRIVGRDLEEPQHRGEKRFEGAIEGQEPARHLFADEPGVVAGLEPEVRAQQIDHREV